MSSCSNCPDFISQQESDLLEIIYKAYDKNGGNENVLKEISLLLEKYPQFLDKKEELLFIVKECYCTGFLKGYKENF